MVLGLGTFETFQAKEVGTSDGTGPHSTVIGGPLG